MRENEDGFARVTIAKHVKNKTVTDFLRDDTFQTIQLRIPNQEH